MNVKALLIAGVTVGVAVVTLLALNLVAPISHAEEGHEQGITADEVFGASIAGSGATIEVAQADTSAAEPAVTAPDVGEPAPSTGVSSGAPSGGSCEIGAPASGEALPAAGTEIAQAPSSEMEPAAAAPAETSTDAAAPAPAETGGSEPAAAGGACLASTTDPDQQPVIVTASGAPDDAPAAPADAGADAPPEMAAEPAPEPEPAPAAAAKPEPAPAAAVAAEPKPKSQPAKPRAPKVAPPEAKKAWWPAKTPGKLNLTYAGSASFTKAIVLIFDGAFDSPAKANENIQVTTESGKPVQGQWLVAKGNPQMLLYSVEPGVYKVQVGAGLTDKGNRPLSAASAGVVFVP